MTAIEHSNKSALFIAYHFPPLQGSTGTIRTLAFSRYLKDWSWQIAVVTAKPNLYPQIRDENYADIPNYVDVIRAGGFDAHRHLSIGGRYPLLLAMPDRWQTWIATAFFKGLKAIRKQRPRILYSTYPIASAHCVGYLLHRATGIPWIADFRDPMAQPDYPTERLIHWSFRQIEKLVFRHCARVVVTSPGTAEMYRQRFPKYPANSIVTIPNGFDPEMFGSMPPLNPARNENDRERGPVRLLHSGLLYPEERNPTWLFEALSAMKRDQLISASDLQIVFRAPGNEADYKARIAAADIGDIVQLAPPVPYQDALSEMQKADGLLLMQASNCNQQIPAKLYEYLYCQRPILGLTDPIGDTGRLLASLSVPHVAPLDNPAAITKSILDFVRSIRNDTTYTVPRDRVMKFSRRERAAELASLFDQVDSGTATVGK